MEFFKPSDETPEFVRIYREKDKEFRQYSGYLLACTREAGSYSVATESAYRRLYAYLSGANSEGIKIPFGAPLFQQKQVNEWTVSVTLPPKYTLQTAPTPDDKRVVLKKVAPKKVAVIEYAMNNSAERIKEKELELLQWLGQQNDFAPISHGRVAQYDAPLGIPFLQRNEIQIDVRIV
jgi:hypothetical protein